MPSCVPSDLAEASKCFCFDARTQRQVQIYALCVWANGGVVPDAASEFGNPDLDVVFGDPGADIVFGVP